MIPRVCGLSAAVLCALTTASLCLAQEPEYGPGRGGIGASLGVSTMSPDHMLGSEWFGDYSAGTIPRFAFAAHFRYVLGNAFRIQVSPGLTWTAYDGSEPVPFVNERFPADRTKGDYLTVMVPVSAQLQYVVRRGRWLYHLGAGPGLYRVWVQHHREILKDPITKRIHRGVYLGGSGELGAAYFLRNLPMTAVEFMVVGDLAVTERDEQFPSGYNSNAMAMSARVGVTYHFTPGQSRQKAPDPAARP